MTSSLMPRAARKRIVFIEKVGRYAYKDVPSVVRHIDEGMNVAKGSRSAVEVAKNSIKSKNI